MAESLDEMTARSFRYRLPWPPSVNRLYRYTPAGVKLSEVGRKYVLAICRALPVGKVQKHNARMVIYATLHAPNRTSYDIDNRMKALFDGCTKACLWADDRLIDEMHVGRGEPDPDGVGYVDMIVDLA